MTEKKIEAQTSNESHRPVARKHFAAVSQTCQV